MQRGDPVSLDVDGSVVAVDELLQRIQALTRTVADRRLSPPAASPPLETVDSPLETALASIEPFVSSMQRLQGDLRPPQLPRARGIRARTSVLAKRVVRKLTWWYVEPRWAVQAHYDALLKDLGAAVLAGVRQVNADLSVVRHSEMRQLEAEIQDLRAQISRLRLQLVGSVERFNRHRRDLDELLRDSNTNAELLRAPDASERRRNLAAVSPGIDYVAFEDKCRGSSEALRTAQQRYLSLFPPPVEGRRVVDLGCGRGEMLELLLSAGYEVTGVDADPGMIELCRAKGLPVLHDDALHYLDQTAPDCLAGIFCAQVVEHLTTAELERLLRRARESLVTGGVLVVETINPRSSFALGNHFFADVTHVRPVHPETLRFLCEQTGFTRVQLEERSPHPAMEMVDRLPSDEVGDALRALLGSVFGYQDYVLVATK